MKTSQPANEGEDGQNTEEFDVDMLSYAESCKPPSQGELMVTRAPNHFILPDF